jgi:predicted MFS family arabinose efflux permease
MYRLEYAPQAKVLESSARATNLRLAAVALAGVFAFLDLYASQPLLPLLAHIFRTTAGAAGLTVSATTFGVAISAPFAGMISDRFGRKSVIVGSLIGLAIPTILAATATSLTALIVWRFIAGIFMPGIIAAVLAYITEEWSCENAASAVATYVTGSVVGGFSGRLISGVLADRVGWQASFIVLGGVTLLGTFAIARWLPSSSRFVPQNSWRRGLRDFADHLRNPQLIATCMVGFSVLFSLVATFTFITFHVAAAPYHLGPASQGALFTVYLLGVFVTPLSGKWIGRTGRRAGVMAAAAMASFGVLLTLAGPLWIIVIGLAICSAGVFVCQAAASSYIGIAVDRARSAASGLYVTFYYIGGSFGAAVPGLIWEKFGWPGCVVLIVAAQLVAATVAYLFWTRREVAVDLAQTLNEVVQ